MEIELETFLATVKDLKLDDGRACVERHGYDPARTIATSIGPVQVARAEILDRGAAGYGERIRFSLAILPLWAWRTRSLRLPGRALGSFAYDQPHRKRVRHRVAQNRANERIVVVTTARLIVFKLVIAASKTSRRLKGTNQLLKVIPGIRFNEGIEVIHMPANHAACSQRRTHLRAS
ncbi:hypothetical protein ABIB08_008810 [Bradyrhizobium sp. RT11b]